MTPRWSVVWRDGPGRSGRQEPRWWRLVCLVCNAWHTEDVDKLYGPAAQSRAVVAALWIHLRTHDGGSVAAVIE